MDIGSTERWKLGAHQPTSIICDSVRIVVADDLPSSSIDLLRAEGWEIDARSGRTPEGAR
jgi:hypothetical protein